MGCKNCPYFKIKSIVPYTILHMRGPSIFIIGESPGFEEEQQKQCFVGKSGLLLREMIIYIPNETSVHLGNSCRCRIDKETESPTIINQALQSCRIFLIDYIRTMKPKLIICVGAMAAKQIMGYTDGVLSLRGRFYTSTEFDCPVFITVHPSYILRGMQKNYPNIPESLMSYKEKLFVKDWKLVERFIKAGFKEPEIDTSGYREARILADFIPYKQARTIGVDAEATGNDMHNPATKLLSVGFSIEKGKTLVITPEKPRLWQEALKILRDPAKAKIVASRPFDEHLFLLREGVPIKGIIFDALTMAHILDENYVINLENVADTHTELHNIKDLAEGYRDHMADIPKEILIPYQGVDADATMQSFQTMKEAYNKEPGLKRYYARFMQPVQDMLAEISLNGCLVDTNKLRENEEELIKLKQKANSRAISYLPKSIREKYSENLSLNRDIILRDYLFQHEDGLKFKPVFFTDKRKDPQITEEHLKTFDAPFIKAYLMREKIGKLLDPYVKRLWASIKADGRIYPQTLFTRTVTGRTVMLSPEIQTYPKRGKLAHYIREVLVADDGYLFGARDLSQSEMRIVGWLAQDPNILKALKEGIDLHERTASKILGLEDINEKTRQGAKACNFGFIYGMWPKKFQRYAKDEYDVDYSIAQCTAFRGAFFAKPDGYYMLPVFHVSMERMVREKGYIVTPLGRKRRLPAIYSEDQMEQAEAIRQAINTPVQSFCSDLGLIGMMLFHQAVKEDSILKQNIKPMWFIHDEILFQAKEDYMDRAHALLKECMEQRSREYIKQHFKIDIGYPIQTDGSQGKDWFHMEKRKEI